MDVQKILQTPLNVEGIDDFVAWNYTQSERSLSTRHIQRVGAPIWTKMNKIDGQGSLNLNSIWKEIWGLRILKKVKIFSWKVYHGVLPYHGVLASHHI